MSRATFGRSLAATGGRLAEPSWEVDVADVPTALGEGSTERRCPAYQSRVTRARTRKPAATRRLDEDLAGFTEDILVVLGGSDRPMASAGGANRSNRGGQRAMPTYFVSRYSSMPSKPPSRPN